VFRTIRTAMQNNSLTAAQIEVLAKANQMAAAGNPAGAAPLFAEVARELDTPHPRRAANLHARAAHAYADANRPQLALEQARAALNLFIQYQMIARTPVFYANITRKLTNKGMTGAAAAIQNEFGGKVGSLPAQSQQGSGHPLIRRGVLPTNCPKCGGPIHGDNVSWVDNQTIECEYCGTLIRSTPNQ
jgi:uncharacterized Zn-finger protein